MEVKRNWKLLEMQARSNSLVFPSVSVSTGVFGKEKYYLIYSLKSTASWSPSAATCASSNLYGKSADVKTKSKNRFERRDENGSAGKPDVTSSENSFEALLKAVKASERAYVSEKHGEIQQYLSLSLNHCPRKVNSIHVNKIINCLKNPVFSLEFYRWAQRNNSKLSGNVHVYTSLIKSFGKAKDFDGIQSLLAEMKAEGCKINDVTYTTMIKCYAEANNIHKAMDLYSEMKHAMIEPSIFTYSVLISTLTKERMYEKAIAIYEDMKRSGLKGSCIFYNNVLSMYGSMGNLPKAYETFELMHSQNILPSVWTYNYMFYLYGKAEQKYMVMRLFERMKKSHIHPDAVTYNTFLYLHHSDSVDDVYGFLLDELSRFGLSENSDAYAYTVLMITCAREGKFQEVENLFREMDDKGLIDGNVPYNILLSSLLAQRKFMDVETVIQEMRSKDIRFNLETYVCLLQACIDFEGKDSIAMWMDFMDKSHLEIHNLLKLLISKNEVEPVDQNVFWSKSRHYINTIMHEPAKQRFAFACTLVHLLCKLNLPHYSTRIWKEFKAKHVFNEDYLSVNSRKWILDLHEMTVETAITVLRVELEEFEKLKAIPKMAIVVTGKGRHSKVKAFSVKFGVLQFLNSLNSPFRISNSNSGVLETSGIHLRQWINEPGISSSLKFGHL